MEQQQAETWTPAARSAVIAAYLGWTLDAFDYFLLIFVLKDIATEFGVKVSDISVATLLTLAARPIGAYVFGRLADHFGRRPVLMADVLAYSIIGFTAAFSPNLTVLLVLRTLFGIAMGGEWGTGASLAMESVPTKARGFVSGLLQSGYPSGYLLAAIAFGILYPLVGWRGLFMASALPALMVLYIRRNVPESPGWKRRPASVGGTLAVAQKHWRRALYAILLMTAFNFFSHGTQDLYPAFLRETHKLNPHTTTLIAVIYNIGAIIGGISSGWLSERFGRRRVIIFASLLALPLVPLWAFSQSVLLLTAGAFLIQMFVQGAWGVIPAHLNELSPAEARGTFPGFVYQLGNLLAASNLVIQTRLAEHIGAAGEPAYATALATVAAIVSIVIVLVTMLGPEARGTSFVE